MPRNFFLGVGWVSILLSSWLPVVAADCTQWGGSDSRNMVSSEESLPATFEPGKKRPDGSGIDLQTTKNVRWVVKLGTDNYATPVIAGGRAYIGINDEGLEDPRFKPTRGGVLMCLDEATGRLLWQFVSPKRAIQKGEASSDFEKMGLGICSTPTVDGDRVYFVSNRGEVICLDVQGMANGNDGPCTDEAVQSVPEGEEPIELGPTDADVIWRFDMLKGLPVYPHDATNSVVSVHGDFVYVATSNGINGTEGIESLNPDFCPHPHSPSLIVLDKKTGRLVGKDGAEIGTRVFHGQWSSTSMGEVAGKTLVFYGGGDGVCYAFETLASMPKEVDLLKPVWSCDCNPPEYKFKDGKPIDYWKGDDRFNPDKKKDDGLFASPSEIIGTPVFYRSRIYVTIGQDPMHGRGRGALTCIDATKTGNVTGSAKIWTYDGIERSLSTVSIADGLVYVADYSGKLHCVDAETGQLYWVHETGAPTWSSTLVADHKVYLGTRKSFWVLAAGKDKQVLSELRLGTAIRSCPVAANGTLYLASQRYLWAVREKK